MKSEKVREAFIDLFPGKVFELQVTVSFSGRIRSFGSRARMTGKELHFSLSKDWQDIDEDIFIGMVQELLCKLYKDRKLTKKMELYRIFIKKLALTIPKEVSDPTLEKSFERVNEKYFGGLMEKPNLMFGQKSIRTIGTYNFHNDTITISRVLMEDPELIDYVMFHELLHKKIQFDHKKSRYSHHSKQFKDQEKRFENHEMLEKRLEALVRKRRFPFFG